MTLQLICYKKSSFHAFISQLENYAYDMPLQMELIQLGYNFVSIDVTNNFRAL